ncbi:MAG: hypothetical protein AVDCRST_MAG69-655 [uncultured Solirubrobacteraceae bacterium]|uniref:Uncharacterized protein n=1 Tax=uncultured Solirubrobacteraceae bacterium TaxID=1162706 RepID=A0A6J4RW45_9ACTN|nr:MAG: hypothetical protein AVDCRST_MAG69-655 [uncultured Solirubrobacteraceae bacterium]
MPLNPLRSAQGQAGSDYVGLLALIGIVTAAAIAVVKPPPIPAAITSTLRHAICLAGGGICTASEARAAGLAACVVHVRSDAEEVGAVLAVVRLRRGDVAIFERRSDGSAVVSFLDANAIGAHAGVGIALGAIGARGTATAAAGVAFNTGRSYEFSAESQARAFLRRYAEGETTAGEALDLARRLSPARAGQQPPAPASVSFEAGSWAELDADLEAPLPGVGGRLSGGAQASTGRLLGRRVAGARTTWYVRVEAGAAARLGAVIGAVGASGRADVVLEVTTEKGRAVAAAVSGSAAGGGDLGLYGHTTDLASLSRRLRAAGAGAGGAGREGRFIQTSVALDLAVRENRDAVGGVLDVLRFRVPPAEWSARLDALGARLDADGRIDVSVFRSATREKVRSAQVAIGAGIGVELVAGHETRELVAAWSAHGGPLREREDCVA